MARMIPPTVTDFHGSKGEEDVFRALKALPDDVTVIHSLRWVHPGNARPLLQRLGAQGEGDFVVIDPARGVMVIEVKGGDVRCEEGEWLQRNRKTGYVSRINPEAQASDTMYRLREEVTARRPDLQNILFCHAVWFPDGKVDRRCLPLNCHPHMTLDGEDIPRSSEAVSKAFNYWRPLRPTSRPPREDAKALLSLLAPSFAIVRSVRQGIDEREELLVQLNRDQARVLDFLDEQMHAAIIGAAGTGKTLLAIEKSRRVASATQPVLFLCFNSLLRDHLRANHAQPNVTYQTFHGFARDIAGPSGSLDDAVVRLLEHLSDERQLPFEHLVIDEAQDFDREWLEFLRHRFRDASFYAFYDRYQTVQGQRDPSWLDDIPCRLVLSRNCRNTDPIARSAYRAGGLALAPTVGIDGPQPTLHACRDADHARSTVDGLIQKAVKEHGVGPHEVAVLTLETLPESSPWRIGKVGGQPSAERPSAKHVTLNTARRFKGLEAQLVIVVDVDFRRMVDSAWRQLLYVAASRARHAVHIVTTTEEATIQDAVRALAGSDKVRASWRALCRYLGFASQETIMILSTNGELDEYDLVREPKHFERVWAAIEASLPKYWEKFVTSEREATPVAKLQAKFGGSGSTAKPGAVAGKVFGDALAAYEKEATRYREFFDPDAMEEFLDDPNAFKQGLSRDVPVIAKTLRNRQAELKEWQMHFRSCKPNDLLTVFANVLDFVRDWSKKHTPKKYASYRSPEDFEVDELEGEDMSLTNVIGMGIKSIVLFHLDPERMPPRGRNGMYGLYFLSGRDHFGLPSGSSEFLMINDKHPTSDGSMIMDQNYWYPYGVFSAHAIRVSKWLEARAAADGFDLQPQQRYVYVDRLFESVCDQHASDLKTMRAHERFEVPA